MSGRRPKRARVAPELSVGRVRIVARLAQSDGVPWDDVAIYADGKFLAAFAPSQAAAVGLALRSVAVVTQFDGAEA